MSTAIVDWDRDEAGACERNTVGCCIDHTASGPESECETW